MECYIRLMQRYAVIRKNVGETPLEAMEAWRTRESVGKYVPLAYAGRLDPMASGALIVLIGDECKRQKSYQGFDKEYRFEVLVGFSSDTGDILGMATRGTDAAFTESEARQALLSLKGERTFRYPRFSSRTVDGIPLHEWTLRGGLPEDRIPTYRANVKRIRWHGMRAIAASDMHAYIHERISLMPPVTDPRKALGADFRRGEILPRWDSLLARPSERFVIIDASTIVSSGTYIRTLAEEIGRSLHASALAYSIDRTRIGTYRPIVGDIGIWYPRMA